MPFGQRWAKSLSKTQGLKVLSSAEPEFYAVVAAIAGARGVQSMIRGFENMMNIGIVAEASAALGIIARRRIGKVRPLDP